MIKYDFRSVDYYESRIFNRMWGSIQYFENLVSEKIEDYNNPLGLPIF